MHEVDRYSVNVIVSNFDKIAGQYREYDLLHILHPRCAQLLTYLLLLGGRVRITILVGFMTRKQPPCTSRKKPLNCSNRAVLMLPQCAPFHNSLLDMTG